MADLFDELLELHPHAAVSGERLDGVWTITRGNSRFHGLVSASETPPSLPCPLTGRSGAVYVAVTVWLERHEEAGSRDTISVNGYSLNGYVEELRFVCTIQPETVREGFTDADRLQILLEDNETAFWEWDLLSGDVFLSRGWFTMLGYPPGSMLSTLETWKELLHPDDRSVIGAVERAVSDGERFALEFRLRCADGDWKWISGRGQVFRFDSLGRPVRVIGVHIDIDSRKKILEKMQRSERQLRSIISNAVDGISVVTADGAVLEWNAAQERISGISYEDACRQKVWELQYLMTPEELREPGMLDRLRTGFMDFFTRQGPKDNKLIKVLQDGPLLEVRITTPDGDKFISQMVFPVDTGTETLLVSFTREITEAVLQEKLLQEREKRYHLALEGAGAGLWDWDMVQDRVFFSPRWKAMLGYADDEVENSFSGWQKLWHPDDAEAIEQAIQGYLHGERAEYSIEHRLLHKDGSYRWILTRGAVLRDDLGQPYRWVGTNVDVTVSREQSRRYRTQQEFLNTVLSSMHDGICVLEPDLKIRYLNPQLQRWFGLSDDAVGKPCHSVFHDLEELCDGCPVLRSLQNGSVERAVMPAPSESGADWFEIHAYPIADSEGAVTGAVTLIRDISLQRNLLERLNERDELLDKLSEQVPGVIYQYRLNPDGSSCFPFASDGIRDIYEVVPLQVQSDASIVFERLHPDDSAGVSEAIAHSAATLQIWDQEYRVVLPEKGERVVHGVARPERLPEGAVLWHGYIRDVTDRVVLVQRMQASELNFRTFFETMDDMIFIGTESGEILKINPAVTAKLGYQPEEMHGMHLLAVHPDEKRHEAETIFSAMFRGERSYCPLPLRAKNGRLIPVETRVWFGEWNGERCIFGISKDRSAEAAALERFERLFDSNPALMALSELQSRRFINVNRAFLERLGYSRQEVLGKTAEDLHLFPDRDAQQRVAAQLSYSGKIGNVPLRVKTRDGALLHGLFSGEVIDNQGEQIFLTVMVDITAQQKTLMELQESREQFQLAVSGSHDGIWDWNLRTNELYLSPRWKEILGYGDTEIENSFESFISLIHPDDRSSVLETAGRYLDGDMSVYEIEFRMIHKSARTVWILARGEAVRDEDGRAYRMAGSHTDITGRKKDEDALLEARRIAEEASAAKSRFLANMSHEIRTPLNGILGFASLLKESRLDLKQQEYADTVALSARTLLELVNDILDYSKIEAERMELAPEPVDLRMLAQDAVSIVRYAADRKGLLLETVIAPEVSAAYSVDPVRIRQILSNLLSNAVKFTAEGFVKLDISRISAVAPDSDRLRFSVTDSGIGISEEQASRVFESFSQADPTTTRKYGGTGLGLAISNRLLEMMQSRLQLVSTPGVGSEFSFELVLPRTGKPDSFSAEQTVPDVRPFAGACTVLIAEDEPINLKLATILIQRLLPGAEIIAAGNGEEAVALYRSRYPEIIFMDIQMPVMDGYLAAATIRESDAGSSRRPLIVALTAGTVKDEASRCKAAGMDDYLSKPVTLHQLYRCLAKLLPTRELLPEQQVPDMDPHFDRQELLQQTGGDLLLLHEMTAAAAEDWSMKLSRLEEALVSNDLHRISREAHRFRGSALSMQCIVLAKMCEEIETTAMHGEIPSMDLLIPLRKEVSLLLARWKNEGTGTLEEH